MYSKQEYPGCRRLRPPDRRLLRRTPCPVNRALWAEGQETPAKPLFPALLDRPTWTVPGFFGRVPGAPQTGQTGSASTGKGSFQPCRPSTVEGSCNTFGADGCRPEAWPGVPAQSLGAVPSGTLPPRLES